MVSTIASRQFESRSNDGLGNYSGSVRRVTFPSVAFRYQDGHFPKRRVPLSRTLFKIAPRSSECASGLNIDSLCAEV
jgi:hypothetical protein